MIPLIKVNMPDPGLLLPALEQVLYSGFVAEGEVVYRFEEHFAEVFGLKNTLAMSSGTAALHAALTLAGVGRGDEVVSTPMTAEPTNIAVLHCGARVVWADVNPSDGTLDPDSVERSITERTKAILVVHYAGYPARMKKLRDVAGKYKIPIIEDCAHALGARYEGNFVGSTSSFGIFSFQAIKHMTTVDGGMLSFSDKDLCSSAKSFRWFGLQKGIPRTEVDVSTVGYKYNMNNVTATIGEVQLTVIGSSIDKHISNGKFYDSALRGVSGVSPACFDANAEPSYWLYTVLCDEPINLEKRLNENGIVASQLHKPNNRHSIFSDSMVPLPGLDEFYGKMLHIPCGWWVSTEDRERIVDLIKKG